jgi:hypothetical protein
MNETPFLKITSDDLSNFKDPAFITFGETMVPDSPADLETLTRRV